MRYFVHEKPGTIALLVMETDEIGELYLITDHSWSVPWFPKILRFPSEGLEILEEEARVYLLKWKLTA